jgi:trehalose 6-phosphate synthase/phosphatase
MRMDQLDNETGERLVIIANRLPYRISEKNGELSIIPSAGGLVSSIGSYISKDTTTRRSILWVGASDLSEKRLKPHLGPEGELHEGRYLLHPVFLPASVQDNFYNGFCNSTLWPLFHYFTSYVQYGGVEYEDYRRANEIFAQKLAGILRPGDRIWVHDYHLMLLPAMLREIRPEAEIGFFLHIPFPSSEVFRSLPDRWRRELLQGVLSSDLIGFHTHDYAQHFKRSVQHVLGYDHHLRTIRTPDHVAVVDAFPISIDTASFKNSFDDPKVRRERNRILRQCQGKRIIFSVDRLDYTKGLLSRLQAFEHFLEKEPWSHGNVKYVMVVIPSRDVVSTYADLRREIEMLVSRINGNYGNIDWTPIVYQYRSIDHAHLVGLYSSADVALITPLRDGMNLVAKEFAASRRDRRGVLVLSETAGAAAELSGAILVNPNDKEAISDAISRALSMPPEEQEERHDAMAVRLDQYDVDRWAKDFLDELHDARQRQERMRAKEITPAIEEKIMAEYGAARTRVLLLDHDGTLVPFARDPARAIPTPDVLELLEELSADARNQCVVISGRSSQELEKWYGHLPLILCAEHGVFQREKKGRWRRTIAEQQDWKFRLIPMFEALAERCPGALVEVKSDSIAWHYRGADRDLGFLRSRELIDRLNDMAPELGFRVTEGEMVVEARPLGADKGTAARSVITGVKPEFIFALGDDRTDEDMFGILPREAWSVCIGLRPSLARLNLRNQKDVMALLTRFQKAGMLHPTSAR